MLKQTIVKVYMEIWPMLFIFCTVLISLKVADIVINKKKINIYREFINLMFIIYILFLFEIVTFQDVSWSSANFTPFKEMFRYVIGSRLFYRNVVGNMIMFLPYGLYVSYHLNLNKARSIILLAAVVSVIIETTQLWIGRVFDIDDIFLNVFGALIGFYLYKLARYVYKKIKGVNNV